MKTPDPQSLGSSASLVETEETPEILKGTHITLNQQLKELSSQNAPLISCKA
jgi:hypothetical protein